MNLVGYALDEAMRVARRNLRRMHILGSSTISLLRMTENV